MERSFIKLFLQETRFPPEACRAVLEAWDRVEAAGRLPALRGAVEAYLRSFSTEETQSALEALSEGCGVPVYTLWLLLLMAAAQPAREDFHRRGLGDGLFWETFSDLRYKALECWRVYRVWGVFVAFWYPIFYTGEILKLGRLEYQEGVFRGKGPVTVGDVTVRPGDPVKQLHIPSCGEPFTREARLDSYRRAFARFGQKPLVCVCQSWLLYPPYEAVWPEDSNIRDFAREFRMLEETPTAFEDAWRVFGAAPLTGELPSDTALQRSFRQYLSRGGSTGCGSGLLIFDGWQVLTRRAEP